MLEVNKDEHDAELFHEIISRVEYLGPTLSVKKMRLTLAAMAKVPAINEVPHDVIHRMMQTLGEELLCRFHSMTLLSCCSIAESMASLKNAKHDGILNILKLAFKQNRDEPRESLDEDYVMSMEKRMREAYLKLGHDFGFEAEAVSAPDS
jgi:hypothetical protein